MKILEVQKSTMLDIDVGSGAVNINVVSKIRFIRDVVITPSGLTDQVTFNSLQKGALKMGKGSTVVGTFIVPNAQVHLQNDVVFKGAICAKAIKVDKRAIYVHHSSTAVLPKAVVVSDAESVTDDLENTSIPTEFELAQNHPNPFNPSTTISFALPQAGEISLKIYNLRGQLVATLHDGAMAAGRHKLVWDGNDARGLRAASGIYLYRLEAKDYVATKKLTLMK